MEANFTTFSMRNLHFPLNRFQQVYKTLLMKHQLSFLSCQFHSTLGYLLIAKFLNNWLQEQSWYRFGIYPTEQLCSTLALICSAWHDFAYIFSFYPSLKLVHFYNGFTIKKRRWQSSCLVPGKKTICQGSSWWKVCFCSCTFRLYSVTEAHRICFEKICRAWSANRFVNVHINICHSRASHHHAEIHEPISISFTSC